MDTPLPTIERVPIDSVTEHPKNPRRGNVERIRESYREHGQYVPILVQASTGYVAKGNHTRRALMLEGATHIDVIRRDMTDEECLRILLVDNRASDDGDYELASLVAALQSLEGLHGTGYNDDDLATYLAQLAPPPEDDSVYGRGSHGSVLALQDVSLGEPSHHTVRGDVWRLGPVTHTIAEELGEVTAGPHFVVVTPLATGWELWSKFMEPGMLFLPYPGPYLPVTLLGLRSSSVMVQPEGYIAGHLVDKWCAVFGDDAAVKL